MENYLNCKTMKTAIDRAKKELLDSAQNKTVASNFGQEHLNNIANKFLDVPNTEFYVKGNKNNITLMLDFMSWVQSIKNKQVRTN